MTQNPTNKSQKEGRISLILICAAYLLITVSYSVINPLFETPDEQLHFFTVVHIATTGTLPHVDANNFNEWMGQEAAQPPLYYLLGASLIAPIDTSEVYEQVWLNPFVWIGTAQATHNLNRAVHTSFENWPWQGYALAAHLLRGLSTLFGLGTLLCIYASARLLWPQQPQIGLIAMSIIAFLPQFNFIQSAISNDTLITFLCSFAVWQLLYLWFNQISMRRLLLLGITIGLAALTKNAGVLLLVFACGMLLLQTLRDVFEKNGRFSIHTTFQCLKPTLWQTAVFVILPVLLMTGWLWLRNHQLYGDWTATEPFIRIAGG
ncbi:MAG: hypothetical protein GY943_33755, partial [Chloroflexi bacterium]|nr:hypothetical protein [Chloroflexota bacterium]